MDNLTKYTKKIKELEEENRQLKNRLQDEQDDKAWNFQWDGRGSYEESRRCFYGDFS